MEKMIPAYLCAHAAYICWCDMQERLYGTKYTITAVDGVPWDEYWKSRAEASTDKEVESA